MLDINDNNLAVVRLQLQLRNLDHYKGLIDGQFGKATQKAVLRFQQKQNLAKDGIVGPVTAGKLLQLTKNAWFVLFLHCSASPQGRDHKASTIVAMHTLPKSKGGRGWDKAGYADVIELDGKLVNIQDWNQDNLIGQWEETYGVKYSTLLNRNARHICYIGGTEPHNIKFAKDTRTPAQLDTLKKYIHFALLRNPKLVIAGHNQVQPKGCPSFWVPHYLESLDIPEYHHAHWGKLYK